MACRLLSAKALSQPKVACCTLDNENKFQWKLYQNKNLFFKKTNRKCPLKWPPFRLCLNVLTLHEECGLTRLRGPVATNSYKFPLRRSVCVRVCVQLLSCWFYPRTRNKYLHFSSFSILKHRRLVKLHLNEERDNKTLHQKYHCCW